MKEDHKQQETALALVVACILFHLISGYAWLLYAGTVLGALGLLSPSAAGNIHRFWEKVTKTVGKVNAYLLLAMIFYTCLLPLAILYRYFKKDPLQLKGRSLTFYKERNHEYQPEDFDRPW